MLDRIRDTMITQKILHQGDRIVTGVSGGADSVCLLCVLAELRKEFDLKLYAVHVHHGIRGREADRDAAFTQELCRRLGVECLVEYRNVPELARQESCSEEEMGRRVRYQILEEYRQKLRCDWIAVAHNREDNAETILWNLCRGSGLAGLTGIRMVRGHIIRPLLTTGRAEIEEWLAERGQDYCTDHTNLENVYTRNRIRQNILPVLTKGINCQSVLHITETAERLSVLRDYIDRQVSQALEAVHWECEERAYWEEEDYRRCDTALRPEAILALLQQISGHAQNFSSEHIRAVAELYDRNVGKCIGLPYEVTVRRTYTGICLEKGRAGAEKAEEYSRIYRLEPEKTGMAEVLIEETGMRICCRLWEPEKNEIVKIPESSCTKWFDYDKILDTVVVRTRRPGDRLVIHPDGQKKKLKDYWIDQKVPQKERNRKWLLAAGQDILWIPGDRAGEGCRVDTETKRILTVQIEDNSDKAADAAE